MSDSHTRRLKLNGSHPRAGLLASTEVTVVVLMLAILCWAGSCLVSSPEDELAAHAALSRASADRPVYRLAMEETGNRLWVFRGRQDVTRMNVTSGRIDRGISSSGSSLSKVAHSRDGATAILATHDNCIYLDREGFDPVWSQLPAKSASPRDLAISGDGSVALVALSDGTVRGWTVTDGRADLFDYQIHRGPLSRMCLDGDGRRLFAAFDNGSSSIHEAMTGEIVREMPNLRGECTAAVWSGDGRRVAVATSDGSLGLIDAASGENVWRATPDIRLELIRVTALEISPDGRWIAAGGLSPCCFVWDVMASDGVRKLSGHAGLVRTVAFAPHAKSLFTGGLDGAIREWSLETFTTLRTFE